MKRLTFLAAMILMLALADVAYSQTAGDTLDPTNINDTWVTMTGNIVDVTVSGTDVTLYFPSFARTMRATYDNGILIYITYYRDPFAEECYINVPEEDYEFCRRLIQPGTPRHRFTLTLSEDGMVLSGTKEINVLQVQWDTDENGDRINHRPAGYRYQYFSDYQWRRANCDFEGLPTLTGNVIERYELIGIIFDFYGLRAEHYLQDFNHRSRIRFVYEQAYLDSNTGVFVPPQAAMLHTHTEPLNGRVVMDEESGEYIIELYPYSFNSYVNLLSGLSMLCYQLKAMESLDETHTDVPTRIQAESIAYVWSHRQALCAVGDAEFNRHIDFISRAIEYKLLSERKN